MHHSGTFPRAGRLHRAVLVLLQLAVPFLPASAQQPGRATASGGASVTGSVFDSIGGAPLRAASVQLVGVSEGALGRSFTAQTDSAGRFAISGMPAGRFLAGFQHPRLDSLGLEIEEQAVTMTNAALRLELATPSSATYIALVCPDRPRGGLLVGHVRQTGTELPLPNANVGATWAELDTTNVFAALRNRESAVPTAPSGWFGLCGLPGDTPLLVRAASGLDSSGFVRVALTPGSVRVTTFHVGGAERVAATGDSSAGARPPVMWRGDAQLSGIVVDRNRQALGNARITVWGTSIESTTDARGRFRLGALPGGTQTVEVRAIGFQPVEQVVTLSADVPAMVDIVLSQQVTELEGVRVTAPAAQARLTPFYERMRDAERGINHGYFTTPEEMERRKPTLITNMLEGLPGIRVIRRSLDPRSAVVHGALREAGQFCVMTIYLDGIRVAGPAGGGYDPINVLIDPSTVSAVEVYPRPVSAPPRYQSLNGTCGVILIWTK